MSGWQRIGVVISVLWLMGFPIVLMMDTNRRTGERYASCLKITDGASRGPARAQEQQCRDDFNTWTMPPATLVSLLLTGKEAWLLWTMILAPVVAIWIVGGIVITAVRSIVRSAGRGVGFHKM